MEVTPPPSTLPSSMPPQQTSSFEFPCNDYAYFKDQLLKSRKYHDNITYMLNKTDNRRQQSNFVHDKVRLGGEEEKTKQILPSSNHLLLPFNTFYHTNPCR